ncbi:uncharacterized protein UTRI_01557 [Ustilago trichophora]|uniref:Uncharacterized protein n=1 Tax=Ustilago trichophora TaxID=86804 RepID=A0A5C3E0H0_9BASI|nr:uncharacterized protein UTRI_01557 [Ustilago trichophora]
MWRLCLSLLVALACIGPSRPATAFPLNHTVSQQCMPLNVTWKAEPSGFPYTVWVLANHGFAQTYRINSDYQPGAEYITFQYVVPPPTAGFTSYVVTVGDSRGDGNTTQALGINTPPESDSNCPAYTGSAAFTYAADSKNGSMIQCGAVNFYNIGTRGTRPFTISFVPLGGTPVSVQVPDRYTLNISNFNYLSYVPFAQGTQFQTVLGDASGPGSGGASEIYTVGPSTFSPFCLGTSYRFPDKSNLALPIASTVAMYNNLPGAIPTSLPTTKPHPSHPTGAIAGGAIGGAIAFGLAIGCLVAFLLYRRRQKAKRDMARSEEVRFVDLDGDEDEDWAGTDPRRSARRNGPGGQTEDGRPANSSYAVSPFVYEPRHHNGSSPDGRYGQSLEMTSPNSTNPSYGELLSAAGISSTGASPSDDYPPRPGNISTNSQSSQNPFSSRSANAEHENSLVDASYASSSSAALHAPARSPSKAQAAAEQARRDARATRRVVQHTDGGALPQPSSDTEDEEVVDELPPEYGGWLQNDPNAGIAGGSSSVQRDPYGGNTSIPSPQHGTAAGSTHSAQ